MFGFLRKTSPSGSAAADPPFTRFDGWLKCLRPTDLSEAQKLALQASFARFYSEAVASPLIKEATSYAFATDQAERPSEAPYRYRRFSGGQDLPAGRYYAVCQTQLGYDGGTLVAELSSYIDPAASGPLHLCDSSDPMHLAVFQRFRSDNPGFFQHSLAVSFFRRRGWASPVFQQLQNTSDLRFGPPLPYSDPPEDRCSIYFPLRVENVSIEDVVDLRLPHVRRWFVDCVFKGLPTARYLYRERYEARQHLSPLAQLELNLDYDAETAAAQAEATKAQLAADRSPHDPPDREVAIHAMQPTGAGNQLRGVTPELREAALLRLLTSGGEGGSPVTDAIGEWLRELGTGALIYPSARMNAYLHVEKGMIVNFKGFNLVDYRDAPRPRRRLRVIQKPATYIQRAHLQYPVAGPPSSAPELAGSFEIKGVSEGETRRRVFLEEMAWQQQRFGHRNGLHSLHYGLGDGHRLERLRLSLLGLRSFTFSGGAALKDSATLVEAAKSELIGNWLCAYLTQVHNVGDSDVYWRREWFCYLPRQSDIPEYTLICPICESETEWCPSTLLRQKNARCVGLANSRKCLQIC